MWFGCRKMVFWFACFYAQVCSCVLMLCYWVGRSKRLSWKGSCGDIHLVKWCESARPEGDRQVSLHLPKPVDRHPFVQADDREGGQKRHRHSRWEHSHLQREREAGGQSTCHFGSGTGQELPGPRGKSVLCNEEGSTRGKTKLFHTNLKIDLFTWISPKFPTKNDESDYFYLNLENIRK